MIHAEGPSPRHDSTPRRGILLAAPERLEIRSLLSTVAPSASIRRAAATLLTVPGQAGEVVDVSFTLDSRSSRYRNEMGLFPVADASGRVGRLRPGSAGYLRAALGSESTRVLFGKNDPAGKIVTVTLPAGSTYSLYLVANGTTARALRRNNQRPPFVYFSARAANPDGIRHLKAGPNGTFAWEDLRGGGGDRDFNDLMARVAFGTPRPGGDGEGGGPGNGASPAVTLDATGSPTRQNVRLTGRVADVDGDAASLRLRVDGGSPIAVAFDPTSGAFSYMTTWPLDGSADGRHTFDFEAIDRAGHVSMPAVTTVTLDTIAPTVAFDLTPATDSGAIGDRMTDFGVVGLVGQTEPGAAVRLRETGQMTTADAAGTFGFDGVLLPIGVRTFRVEATDLAGNVGLGTQTLIHCGIADDLSGWQATEQGGSDPGRGSVVGADEKATLTEGNSFLVNLATGFTIPAGATRFRFELNTLAFDTGATGLIRDAFEAALVDASGRPLVPTIGLGRDAFYNATEGIAPALGPTTTVDGSVITVDLTGVAAGTAARLIFRLVNNDGDTTSTATVGCPVVLAGADSLVPGAAETPGLTTDFAVGIGAAASASDLASGSAAISSPSSFYSPYAAPTTRAGGRVSPQSLTTGGGNGDGAAGSPDHGSGNLVTLTSGPSSVTTSAGREFWIGFADNLLEGGHVPVKTLFLTGDVPTQGTVSIPGLGFSQDFTVTPGQVTSVPLPTAVQVTALATIEDKGVHIVADDPITVYGLNNAQSTTDAFLALPVESLGTNYVNMAYGTTAYFLAYLPTSQLTIVGAEDGTTVTIAPGSSVAANASSNAQVIGPDGRVRADNGDGNDIGPLFLDASGTFSLRVASSYATQAGTYTFRILDLDADSTPLTFGQATTAMLPTGQETVVYRFSGSVGQRILYDTLDTTNRNTSVRLITPGLTTAYQIGSSEDSGTYTLGETGTYYLVFSGRNASAVAAPFRVVDVTNPTPIALGDTASGTLTNGNEAIAYGFAGTAGQVLALDLLSTPDGRIGYRVIGPGETTLFTSSFTDDSGMFTLPTSGTYRIEVRGATSAGASFAFRLQDLDGAPALTLGATTSATFATGRETRWYTVALDAGQAVALDALGPALGGYNTRLYDPSGNVLVATSNASQDSDPVVVPRSGTYRLMVQATSGVAATTSFRLLNLANATPLTPGVTITPNFPTGRETAYYRFQATAGSPLVYDGQQADFQDVAASLYDPTGNRLFDINADSDRGPILAPTTGTYLLATRAATGIATDARFRLLDLSTAATLTLGTTTTVSLPTGRDTVVFRFATAAGQQLVYDIIGGGNPSTTAEIFGAGLATTASLNAGFDRGPILIGEGGTSYLVIRGGSDSPVSLDFRLIDAATAPLLNVGTPNAGTLAPSAALRLHRIDSPGGQSLHLAMSSLSDPNAGNWSISGPDGLVIASRSLNQALDARLARPGSYLLILSGSNSAAASVSYSFDATTVADTPVTPSGFGTTQTLTITAGTTATYSFNAPAGRLVVLDSLTGTNANLNVVLTDPTGAILIGTGVTSDHGPFLTRLAGTYTLTLQGNNATAAGSTTFRMLDLSAAPAITPGTDVSDTAVAFGITSHRIDGIAGQRLVYNGYGSDFANVQATLVDPSGNVVRTINSDSQDGFGPLSQTGPYTLLIQNYTGADQPYRFRMLDPATAPVLTLGTDVSGAFAAGRSTVIYRVSGTAGQALYYDALQGDFAGVSAQLLGPGDTSVFFSNSDSNNGPIVLTQTGTYVLILRANTATATDYAIRLLDLASPAALTIGATTTADLGTSGRGTLAYQFAGNAGQTLLFDGLDATTNLAGFRILDASGRTVASRGNNDDFYPIVLPTAGSYTMLVEGGATGPTTMRFRLVDAASAAAMTTGTTISGTLADGRSVTVYRIDAVAGQGLFFNGLSASGSAQIQLFDRSFDGLFTRSLDDDIAINVTTTGSYYLVVRGLADAAVNYAFRVIDLAAGAAIVAGQDVTGTLPTGREFVAHTFQGTAGQRLYFDSLATAASSKQIRLLGPGGAGMRTDSPDFDYGPITLTETGTYTFLIAGYDNAASSYAFRLLDAATAPVLVPDSPTTIALGSEQVALYKIDAAAATAMVLHASVTSPNVEWLLYDPGNRQVVGSSISNDLTTTTRMTGTYLLVVTNRGSSPASVTIRSTLTADAPLAKSGLGVGTTLNVPIGGSQTYTFQGPAGTRIYVDPILSRFTIPTHTITLDAGQTYQLRDLAGGDMTGTVVTSDKPVAVFGGNLAAFVPDNTFAANHLVEQLTPTSAWGREFLTYPLATRTGGDVFRVLAAQDDTVVTINGQAVATLAAGRWYETTLANASRIVASRPVLVAQFSRSLSNDNASADPFMILVPPHEQFLDHYTITTPATGFPVNYVNIVAPASAIGGITLDGVVLDAALFHAIGTSSYVGAQVAIEIGAHDLAGTQPFGVFIYGYATYDGYGYLGGQSLSPVATVAGLAISPATASLPVGSSQTFTARAVDADGNPVAGIRVDFVAAGANATTGYAFTDDAGVATFTLVGTVRGSDILIARVGDLSATANVAWRGDVAPPTITITSPGPGSSFAADSDLLISGIATADTPAATLVAVTIDGAMVDVLDAAGRFFAKVRLKPGQNRFQLVAIDSKGQETATVVTIEGTQRATGAVDWSRFADVSGSFAPLYARTSYNDANGQLHAEIAVENRGQYEANAPLLVGIANLSDPSVRVLGAAGVTPEGIPYYDFTGLVTGGTLAPEGQTGFLLARFLNPDHHQFTYSLVFLGRLNEAPSIDSLPATEAIVARSYVYQVAATDPNGDALDYRVESGPDGLTIDESGRIAWTPGEGDVGSHDVTLVVDDGRGGTAEQRFVLSVIVAPPNRPPVFASLPGVVSRVGSLYAYQIVGKDPDGDSLAFRVVSGPDGLTVDANGRVTWTPTADHVGSERVVLALDDGRGGTAEQAFDVCVLAAEGNHTPIIVALPSASAIPGGYASQVIAVDGDADQSLRYLLIDGPAGMAIDAATGRVTWATTLADVGAHAIAIRVEDGQGGTASAAFTLTVRTNVSPVIQTLTLADATVGVAFTQDIVATDDDGNALTFALASAPAGMTIDATTGRLAWMPDASAWEVTPIVVRVDDGVGGVASRRFDLNVIGGRPIAADSAPVFTTTPPTAARVGERLIYRTATWSPVASSITFDLVSAPAGMAVDAATGILAWQPTVAAIGGSTVVLRATDDRGRVALQVFQVTTEAADTAPVITSIPVLAATVGLPWSYRVAAQDAEGDTLSARLASSPAGMTITPSSGGDDLASLAWTPTTSGSFEVTIAVDDGQGGIAEQSFTLLVVATSTNRGPVITSTPRTVATFGAPWFYPVAASDPDGDPPRFALTTAPSGLMIDAATGRMLWTPTSSDLGDHQVVVVVRDGRGGEASQAFTLKVVAEFANAAPTIVSTPPTAIVPDGRTFAYALRALDPDNDPVRWGLDAAPAGVSIDPASGVLVWTPDESQLGAQTIVVRATDPFGASSTQTIRLVISCADAPPTFLSTPITTASADVPYFYGARAIDPEGDALTYALQGAPDGMTIDARTGLVRWTPSTLQVGTRTVTIVASDGFGGTASQPFAIEVGIEPPDRTPVITSIPVLRAPVDEAYTYQVRATDPEGRAVSYSLISAPTGMTIDASGLIRWTATADAAGTFKVVVAADDPGGHRAYQRYTLLVRTNAPPIITSSPVTTAAAGGMYRYDVRARDPEGDAIAYSLVGAPDGLTIDANGRIRWSTVPGDAGDYSFRIVATDDRGANASQDVTLTLRADTRAPTVKVIASANPAAIGTLIVLVVQASDDVAIASITLAVDGQAVALNAQGQATLTYESSGLHSVVATATDAAGNTKTATMTLRVIDPANTQGPTVTITSPTDAGSISAPTAIIGTVSSPALASYRVEYALADDVDENDPTADDEDYRLVAERVFDGSARTIDGVLATLDPSLLTNDRYIVRVIAFDANGNATAQLVAIDVTGGRSLGQFAFSVTDLSLSVAGLPVAVTRTYDSRQSNGDGDFGFGWSLSVQDAKIRESVAANPLEIQGLFFAATPFKDGTRVTLTGPDGRRVGFTFRPIAQFSWFGGTYYLPRFVADSGVTATLSVDATALTRAADGSYAIQYIGFPYNPSVYRLRTKDGTTYEYNQFLGLEKVTSRAGDTLTYTEAGIVSSTGVSVRFDRDPQGRITRIVAPDGSAVTYAYDADGDLAAVTDATGRTTRYGYFDDPAHFLTTITDPAGRVSTATFDSQGRLSGLVDASGNVTVTTYDTAGGTQTVVDALGNATTLAVDDRGNVVRSVDPLGLVRTFTYDADDNTTSATDAAGHTVQTRYDSAGNLIGTTDALGNVSTVTYDASNNITSVTDARGSTSTTLYDANGRIVGLVNALGQRSSLTRDAMGRIIASTDNLGAITRYEYDGANPRPSRTIYPDGSITRASYDAKGYVTRSVDAGGAVRTFTYDAVGRPLTETGPLGGTTTYVYDDAGQLVSVSDPLGLATRYEYDASGRRTATITPLGDVIRVVYDANNRIVAEYCCDDPTTYEYRADGRLIRKVDAHGGATTYTYDDAGNITSVTDALGRVTTSTYDAMGRVTSTTDDLGGTTRYEYDAIGNEVRVVDALGRVATSAYDALGRLVAVADPSGTASSVYDAGGRIVSSTDAAGGVTRYTYDTLGRMLTSSDPLGRTTRYEYDANGRVVAITDPDRNVFRTRYDAAGRIVSRVDDGGRTTSYGYDASNRNTSIIDGEGHTTTMAYDAGGNVIRLADPTGAVTTYEYDEEGRRIAIVDPEGNRTAFAYNCLGQLVRRVDPLGGVMAYEYDAVGNLIHFFDRDGRVRSYTYDALNRPIAETWQEAAGAPIAETLRYTYDALGRMTAAADDHSAYQLTYDTSGNLATIDNAGTPGSPHVVLSYQYNNFGQVTATSDNLGLTVAKTYDDAGQLTSTNWRGAGVAEARVDFVHDANGQRTEARRYADVAGTRLVGVTTSTYDASGLLSSLTMTDGPGSQLVGYTYSYDANGSLTSESHHGQSWNYDYDNSGQLVAATLAGQPVLSETYAYDASGNRTDDGAAIGDANRLAADNTYRYDYDAEGNLARRTSRADGSTTSYAYDLRNRLIAVVDRDGPGTVTQAVGFTYDVFDRRIAKTVNGRTTYTVFDGQAPWADFDASGSVTARYLAGPNIDEPLARDRPGEGTTWYLADRLGTVRDLADANGTVVDHVDYDAFGVVLGETNPSRGDHFKYTGQAFDVETGLHYFRARYYDPALGRFLSQDPIGFDGADANLYRYVGNAPTNATDPSGLAALSEWTGLLPNILTIADAAITYGGDKPMTIAIGIRNGQVSFDTSGSPSIPPYELSNGPFFARYGPNGSPQIGSRIPYIPAEIVAEPGPNGPIYTAQFSHFSSILPKKSFPDPGHLTTPTAPGPDELQFLAVSTAKTPNAVASWDVAAFGIVAVELSLIAEYAASSDVKTLIEYNKHLDLGLNSEWAGHGFVTSGRNLPTPANPSSPPPPPPPPPPTVTPAGSPPGSGGPPDDGDNGGGGGGGGSGPVFGCSWAPPLFGIVAKGSRSYLWSPYFSRTSGPASRDAAVLRLLNRVIGP